MKRRISVFFACAMTAVLLAACGNSSTVQTEDVLATEEAARETEQTETSQTETQALNETETQALNETETQGTQMAGEGADNESMAASQETAPTEGELPSTDTPFAELVYAPYQSANSFGDIDSAEAADAYRQSLGVENEGTAALDGGVELYFSSGESWDLETGESFDSVYLQLTGTETISQASVYTYYSYSGNDLTEVVTDFGTVKDASSSGLPPVGGFADFAAKYNCFSIADFFTAIEMAEEGLMTALEENSISYETSFETAFGTVEVQLDDYTFNGVKNRQVEITFPDGTSSPWKEIILLEYEDSMSVNAWTEAYRWLE